MVVLTKVIILELGENDWQWDYHLLWNIKMEISSFMNILLWYDARVAYHRAILTVSKVVTYCVTSGELIPFSEPAFF